MRGHVAEPVERSLGAERRGRGLGGVLTRGADAPQLVAGQRLQGGHVRVGPPVAAPLRHGCSDDSYADSVCHLNLPALPRLADTSVGRRPVAGGELLASGRRIVASGSPPWPPRSPGQRPAARRLITG